ncbi:MAG TPA: hypothetical protein VNY78_00795 [Edaphobacter sp.]|jgi:hypothetical protein|nr:hypothetical protein [Edaphobacter sp.]
MKTMYLFTAILCLCIAVLEMFFFFAAGVPVGTMIATVAAGLLFAGIACHMSQPYSGMRLTGFGSASLIVVMLFPLIQLIPILRKQPPFGFFYVIDLALLFVISLHLTSIMLYQRSRES